MYFNSLSSRYKQLCTRTWTSRRGSGCTVYWQPPKLGFQRMLPAADASRCRMFSVFTLKPTSKVEGPAHCTHVNSIVTAVLVCTCVDT